MDQQAKYTKSDILDLSLVPSNESPFDQRVNVNEENHLRTHQTEKKKKLVSNIMYEEELKIRDELENEIERNLEEETKDGIYQLALRLHRLYQHKMERTEREVSRSVTEKKNRTACEVNISIKMEGGTKIEIKETKKEAPDHKGSRPLTSRSDNVQGMHLVSSTKKHWAKSLRSGSADPIVVNKKKEISNQAKVLGWKWQTDVVC